MISNNYLINGSVFNVITGRINEQPSLSSSDVFVVGSFFYNVEVAINVSNPSNSRSELHVIHSSFIKSFRNSILWVAAYSDVIVQQTCYLNTVSNGNNEVRFSQFQASSIALSLLTTSQFRGKGHLSFLFATLGVKENKIEDVNETNNDFSGYCSMYTTRGEYSLKHHCLVSVSGSAIAMEAGTDSTVSISESIYGNIKTDDVLQVIKSSLSLTECYFYQYQGEIVIKGSGAVFSYSNVYSDRSAPEIGTVIPAPDFNLGVFGGRGWYCPGYTKPRMNPIKNPLIVYFLLNLL